MLIVAGSFITEPGGREPFLTAVQSMVAATLEESGCREYAFTPDPNDDNRIMLYELWDDQEALDAHFASDHMAAWQASKNGLAITSAEVKRYIISSVESLR
jgi:quinol monooxygenase YgiN